MDKAERDRLREQTKSVVIAAYPSAASWMNDTPYGVTRQPVSEDRRVAVDRLLVLALLDALDAAEARERALREAMEKIGQQVVNAWNAAHHGKTRARLLEISTAVRAALAATTEEQ